MTSNKCPVSLGTKFRAGPNKFMVEDATQRSGIQGSGTGGQAGAVVGERRDELHDAHTLVTLPLNWKVRAGVANTMSQRLAGLESSRVSDVPRSR